MASLFSRRSVSPIVAVLVGVGAYRASLVGRGAMAFLDETMYYKAALALDQLRTGHVAGAFAQIASNNARPGHAILQMAPAALQAIPFAFGIPPSNPRSLVIPVAFNALVSLVALYLFWRLSLVLFEGNRSAAAAASVVYGLLMNSNLYVRHLLAVEPALAIGMLALLLAVDGRADVARAAAIGALSGFAVTVYPGYYLFALIPGVVLVRQDRPHIRLAAFAGGFALVIAIIEVLCRAGGGSYIAAARALSGTIAQGSYDEGWLFLPRYLLEVERYAGVALLIGVAGYGCRAILEIARGGPARLIHWVMLPSIAAWLYQAAGSAYAHNMVLYGRLLHPWMAFLVWATIDAAGWPPLQLRRVLYVAVLSAAVTSWAVNASAYARLAYPSDVLYALGIDTARLPAAQRQCRMTSAYAYDSPAPLNRRTGEPYTARNDYLLVNFCQGRPAEPGSSRVEPGLPVVYRAPHFMAFPAYGFEGLGPGDRAAMKDPINDLRVFAIK